MSKPSITFVSAFIDLNEEDRHYRESNKYIELFKKLAESGISICLYLSSKYENVGVELSNEFKNVKIMPITNLEDTETYKLITNLNPKLPKKRANNKDTINYLILMNAKREFV